MYKALADAIAEAEKTKTRLADVALAAESRDQGRSIAEIRAVLKRALDVMRGAIEKGSEGDLKSASGLVGGDAAKLRNGARGPLADTVFRDILTRALAVQEVNAAMGVIVAAPTAGGAGVLPAILTGLAKAKSVSDEKVVDGLATAGLIGAVVAERASLSGAEGGCQAETGAAAGMAAGAATEMLGGTPSQVGTRGGAHDAGNAGTRLRSVGRARRTALRVSERDRLGDRAGGNRDGAGGNHLRDPG